MADIKELLRPVWNQVVNMENSAGGQYIGDDLQKYLEGNINAIIPEEVRYQFNYNLTGQHEHVFYDRDNPDNQFKLGK